MGSVYKEQLNDWVSKQEVRADLVLDIGGAQSPIKDRTRTWEVSEYYIVDLEEPHSNSPKPDIVQDMNHTLKGDIEKYRSNTDLIFMLGVMDYVINPNIAMQNIYELLSDSGAAWIEWPFVYATHEPIMYEGLRYSEGCINRLCKQAGLGIVEIIRKMEQGSFLRQFYAAERMRAAKNYPYHGVTGFITKVTR